MTHQTTDADVRHGSLASNRRAVARGRIVPVLGLSACVLLIGGSMGIAHYLGSPSQSALERNAPSLVVDAPAHDFGVVRQGEYLEHLFRVTNAGTQAIHIRRVVGCCGTSAALLGDSRIGPGEWRYIRLAGRSDGTPAPVSRYADIETDDHHTPRLNLKLSWRVSLQVQAIPQSIDFGELDRKLGGVRFVDLVYLPRGFRILGVEAGSPCIRAERVELPATAAFQRIRVSLRTNGLQSGEFLSEVRLRTNDRRAAQLAIPVRATVPAQHGIQFSPLALGIVPYGDLPAARGEILLRTTQTRVPRITLAPTRRFHVTLSPMDDGRRYLLTATARSLLPPGRIAENIQIHAGHHTVVIPITGYVEPELSSDSNRAS